MIIINKMKNKRLKLEISNILNDITNFIEVICNDAGVSLEKLAKETDIKIETIISGKFTLGQYMRICFYLEISPTQAIHRFYDKRQVILK